MASPRLLFLGQVGHPPGSSVSSTRGPWAQRCCDAPTFDERGLTGLAPIRSDLSQEKVARCLGVTPAAACRWKLAADRGGAERVRAIPRAFRPSLVSKDHQAELPEILAQAALANGFSTDHWTIPCVVKMAESRRASGAPRPPGGRMLKRHGLSW